MQHFEGMKIIDAVAAELTKRQKPLGYKEA